ncbi:MAG TPA: AMIN domain-containing protein, partial [Blastocatellia bacterium]|nr:AMIN domain-containing protein [Blastocatellia bacterium]
MKIRSNRRVLCWGVLLFLGALSGMPAHARVRHGEPWARDRFAAAERMREALNGRPPGERTRRDYQRVINAYRSVYYGTPNSTKADPSAVAVAETLVEMGRRFEDDKILSSAIAQYKFLRREYPGSKYRCDALFTIGEIYKDDLDDPEQARATFEEFLKRYPHNRLVEDAQQAIAELKREPADKGDEKKAQAEKDALSEKRAEARPGGGIGDKPKSTAQTASAPQSQTKDKDNDTDNGSRTETASAQNSESDPHHLPRVTGIRHWSTPDYTRVAIDLESEVKFGSQRISHPDRIFFDLRDTKLASTLVGKTFEVDDGFLKKIRVAQFQPGRTRVVLEVDDLSTYEAFLLPNPYRLIVDIHGKNDKIAHTKLTKEEASTLADVEAPPQTETKAHVPQPVVKADMKALAGKPVTKTEEIHDQNVAAKDEAPDTRANKEGASTGEMAKATNPPVKKVVVYNDDDEEAPSTTRRSEVPTRHSSSRTKRKGANSDNTADDDSPAERAMNDVSSPTRTKGKSSSRLTASRKDSD